MGVVITGLLVGGGLYYAKHTTTPNPIKIEESPTPQVDTQDSTNVSQVQSSPQNSVRGMWTTFSNYLTAAKTHNIQDLKEYAYALSDVCKDPKQEKACFDKMDAVYAAGSKLQEGDFVIRHEDGKQGILETNLMPISSDTGFGYRKSIIIFVKDGSGNPKLISLKPSEEWRVKRNPASTTAELQKSLEDMVKDTDQDGLTDHIEQCIFADNMLMISCVESNPNKRDSDGDGYWDGVGFLIPKK